MDNHEKQFLIDAERKHTINKALTRVKNMVGQRSKNQSKLYAAIEDNDQAATLPKSKLKKLRKKLSI